MKADRLTCSQEGVRLDAYLARQLEGYSRAFLQGLIERGCVRVDGVVKESSFRLKTGQNVEIKWPYEEVRGPRSEVLGLKKGFEKWIIFEDKEILVLNKPPGLVIHPAGISWLNHPQAALMEAPLTLVGYLLKYRPEILNRKVPRVGIVHRLDRETSGVMAVAKTVLAYRSLTEQFKSRKMKKIYRAIVEGVVPNKEGVIKTALGRRTHSRKMEVMGGGKEAVTAYRVLRKASGATWLEVHPMTGRTHQIRVHLTHLGHPVWGDEVYGENKRGRSVGSRMLLHAYRLEFAHPKTGKTVHFMAPIPKDFGFKVRGRSRKS
ncbi:MAG: RluA family pseudouridine synthase [Elusimicrobia bacterium]|nr:RluA family pseudouridine synthase [Elusimicrobiota bacterium]